MKKKNKEKKQKPPDKRVEREQEYEDYFLAKQSHLSQNTLIEILLGFPKKGLENAKRQAWRISAEGIAENKAKVEAAKRAAGTQLGTFTHTAHPATVRRHESLYELPTLPEGFTKKDCFAAGRVYENLLKWMSLQFPQVREGQPYPTVEFFEWVERDEILEKLKTLGAKIPNRAERFLKFIKAWNEGDESLQSKKTKTLPIQEQHIPPSKPGTGASQNNRFKSKGGRPGFNYSDKFREEVLRLINTGIPKKEIPFRASITRLFAPSSTNEGKVVDKDEYKELYKHSLKTVRKYVNQALN